MTLTYDGGGDESGGGVGRCAAREQWVQQVLGARQRDHGVSRREDHPQRHPQVQERREVSERLVDVGVHAAGLGDDRAQLSEAQSADQTDHSAQCPDDERKSHGPGLDEHALRRDEDAAADDGAEDERDAAEQS